MARQAVQHCGDGMPVANGASMQPAATWSRSCMHTDSRHTQHAAVEVLPSWDQPMHARMQSDQCSSRSTPHNHTPRHARRAGHDTRGSSRSHGLTQLAPHTCHSTLNAEYSDMKTIGGNEKTGCLKKTLTSLLDYARQHPTLTAS